MSTTVSVRRVRFRVMMFCRAGLHSACPVVLDRTATEPYEECSCECHGRLEVER